MTQIIQMKNSNGDSIFPVPARVYKYYASATENDSITLGKGIWLIMTGRFNATVKNTLGLFVATTRPDITAKIQIEAILEPSAGVTITPDTATGGITVTTTLTNMYICALALHTW